MLKCAKLRQSDTYDDFSVENSVFVDGRVAEDVPGQVVPVAVETQLTTRDVGTVGLACNEIELCFNKSQYF